MDVANIYAVPLDYHREGLDSEVLDVFGIDGRARARPAALGGRSPRAIATPTAR